MFTNIRLFRSPDGDLGPTLADLDNPNPSPITGGDGTPKPPVLEVPQADPASPADPAEITPPADPTDPKPDPNIPDPDADGDEPIETTPEEFYGTVSKLSGIDIQVEFPEGVDPLSPEGVAHRDKVILQKGAVDFESYLKDTAPRAYAYFLHQQAGGQDDEFFAAGTGYTLPDRTAMADSVDIQTAVYKHDLLSKGLDEDMADALVAKAIKDNKLGDKAAASYGTIEASQRKQLEDAQARAAEQERSFRDTVAATERSLDKQINELSFVVPEAQKGEFRKFAMDNLRIMEDGKVYVVQELAADADRKVQLEALLFQWKKGDLSTIVRKAATTVATQRLRAAVQGSKTGTKKDEGIGGSGKQSLPLSAI